MLIALSRKFVILDPDISPSRVAAFAGALLALGIVYWLMRERGDYDLKREQERSSLEEEGKSPEADKTNSPAGFNDTYLALCHGSTALPLPQSCPSYFNLNS